MIREIKFRAFNVLTRDWEYYTLQDLIDGKAKGVALTYWCQDTGIVDRNEKRIFDGDIIEQVEPFEDNTKVIYQDGRFGLSKVEQKDIMFPLYKFKGEVKIIGNVFDNIELLNIK